MNYICMHDKKEIEQFLNKDPFLHIYSIGDLDDFFWPYTHWYGFKSNGCVRAIALLYMGMQVPTLLAFSNEPDVMKELLIEIQHFLPARFYAHLSPDLESALAKSYDFDSHGKLYKMALTGVGLSGINCDTVRRLSMKDLPALQILYQKSYPENWFDPRMLETKQYFGIWDNNSLVSIAGIHVYSSKYKVAALGNITTLPSHRNNGYGKLVTARLCQALISENMNVGLNVRADNNVAISCYEKLGFKTIACFGEFFFHESF